jgi:hypothetical protein
MKLRPYQLDVARAAVDSIRRRKGLTLSVEIARQGGKNELSAHFEVLLLTLHMAEGGTLVKCSPTFRPQTLISIERLKDRLDDFGFGGIYRLHKGYIVQLGNARAVFLSAEGSSSVVGHTADLLLEVDEAQDVSKEKYTKEFRPMGSATNVTTILYGTTWDSNTLLEEVKQSNLELERTDGIRRHFRYDWQEVGRHNPDYLRFVEGERGRLGQEHPLFRTQYALLPITGGGGLLSRAQIAMMMGDHDRQSQPSQRSGRSRAYVAGIDLAGEHDSEATAEAAVPGRGAKGQDSTVITIAELSGSASQSALRVVEQYRWTGTPHSRLYGEMTAILRDVWNCRRIVVDATGIGQPVAGFLRQELGRRVVPFVITARSKSDMGFELLSFINSGRLKLYRQDGSAEYRETLFELEKARAQYRPNQTMSFYVDPHEGHDDFLVSLALLVQAAKGFGPREAKGRLREG